MFKITFSWFQQFECVMFCQTLLWVDSIQSDGKNTTTGFRRLFYQNLLKFDILKKNSYLSNMFTYYCLILISLNWNSGKKSWKRSVFQYLSFQNRSTILHFSCYKLAELWPRTTCFSSKYISRIPLKVSRRHTYENCSRSGDIGEYIREVLTSIKTPRYFESECTLIRIWVGCKVGICDIATLLHAITVLLLQ